MDQLAASRTRTTEKVWTKPNPTRRVARTATRSEVKNTLASAFTSAARRKTVYNRLASAEVKRLKAENRRLRENVEILQAATVFFAGELDPRNR